MANLVTRTKTLLDFLIIRFNNDCRNVLGSVGLSSQTSGKTWLMSSSSDNGEGKFTGELSSTTDHEMLFYCPSDLLSHINDKDTTVTSNLQIIEPTGTLLNPHQNCHHRHNIHPSFQCLVQCHMQIKVGSNSVFLYNTLPRACWTVFPAQKWFL